MFGDKKNLILLLFSAFAIFLFSAIYITYPLIFHLSEYTTGFGDELLIAWIQNHAIYSLIHNPLLLFDGNIFFPYQNTIAYSDLFLTSSALSAIPIYLFKEPITAVNFTLFSSLVLLGFSVFLLSYYLTKNFMVSIISGLLVIFSPAVLDKKVHLQILSIQWIPLSMVFFIHFLKSKQSKWLAMSTLFFVLQTANSFVPGYFLIFFFAVFLISLFLKDKKQLRLFTQKRNMAIIFVSFALITALVIPYYKVSQEFNYKRDIRDSIHFALQPEDFLVAGSDSRLDNVLPRGLRVDKLGNGEIKPGFVGLAFSILGAASVVYFFKKKKKDLMLTSLFSTGILGLITSLGPALHWGRATVHSPFPIPLPYALFYYILPGFSGFRNSARWEMLLILCFAVIIAVMLNELLQKLSKVKSLIIYSIIAAVIILEFNFPMKFYEIPKISEFPKAYNFLASKNEASVFIPICNWNDKCEVEEFKRLYFSTQGFSKMVNGTSGFSPPPWQSNIQKINADFPSDSSLQLIRQTGTRYIVFEADVWEKYNSRSVLEQLESNKSIKLIEKLDKTYVFKL